MFLAGEQNCTAQRPIVTQIKGDSAEGERTVRVFLLPEKWGDVWGSFCLSLPPGSPQVQHTWAGWGALSPGVSGEWGHCHVVGSAAHTALPCALWFYRLWCPPWAVFCRLGKGALGGFNQSLHSVITMMWLQLCFSQQFRHLCCL